VKRKAPPDDHFPRPWNDPEAITREAWVRHREVLMSGVQTGFGSRPPGWWIHERGMRPPAHQARELWAMGELKGGERERLLMQWRDDYDRANAMPGDRRGFYRWAAIPPELVKKWDRERGSGAASK
jgi:hypothetical protein